MIGRRKAFIILACSSILGSLWLLYYTKVYIYVRGSTFSYDTIVPSITKHQKSWCLNMTSWEGYVMQDTCSCWTVGNALLVNDENHQEHRFDLNMRHLLAHKRIHIIGDSLSRYFFNALKSTLNNSEPGYVWSTKSHQNRNVIVGLNTTIMWKWAPRAKDITNYLKWSKEHHRLPTVDHTMIMMGLHEVVFNYNRSKEDAANLASELHDFRPFLSDLTFQTAAPVSFSALNTIKTGAGDKYLHDFPHAAYSEIEKYNLLLVNELRLKNITSVLDGYWRFKVNDSDGKHSIVHARHSSYRYLWKLYWFYA